MRPLLLALLSLALACSPPASLAPEPVAPRVERTSASVARATDARIEVSLAGPSRVLYSPATMRAPRPSIKITVTNPNAQPLDVADLRVRLDVTRGSQRVRCSDPPKDPNGRRGEPSVLAPGASFTWVRTVDCPLALAGSYVVQVVVAFGHDDPFASGVVTNELALSVAAPPDARPRAIEAVPGLYAGIGSGGLVPSSTSVGRIVVALVNGSGAPIALPAMRVATRVRRVGTDIPCEDEPAVVDLPARLEPGEVLTRPIDVSCLGLGVTGTYDVEARLLAGDIRQSIGTLRIDVSTDPSHQYRRLVP
jgi:hypothetical protein